MYKAVYTERECTVWGIIDRGCKFFEIIIKIDQSETNKNHMLNTSLKLTNHKCGVHVNNLYEMYHGNQRIYSGANIENLSSK